MARTEIACLMRLILNFSQLNVFIVQLNASALFVQQAPGPGSDKRTQQQEATHTQTLTHTAYRAIKHYEYSTTIKFMGNI
jgi:hypothetical protein